MNTISRYAAILLYVLPLFLASSCGLMGSKRDNYWGKDTIEEQAVRRDEYGNPILDDKDDPSR